MSSDGLQQVVCRGVIDPAFVRELATAPSLALMGFELADDERAMLVALNPRSLADLARGVESWRRGDLLVDPRPARMLQPADAALIR